MVRLAGILILGACAVFSAASALPEAGDGLIDAAAYLEKRAHTVTRTSTKRNGHTVVKTTTRSKKHRTKTTAKPTSTTTTTTTPATSPSSCAAIAAGGATYTDSSGHVFDIKCGSNFQNADIHNTVAPNFAACFPICDAYSGCVAFTYFQGSCYLKNAAIVGAPPTSGQYDSAKLTNAPTSASGPCSEFGSTYIDSNGSKYTIYCGGDLSNYYSSALRNSFGECFAACDGSSGCKGFTYSTGLCQLSNNPVATQNGPGFDSAVYVGKG